MEWWSGPFGSDTLFVQVRLCSVGLRIHHARQSAGRPYSSPHGDTYDDTYQQRPPVMIQNVIYVYLIVSLVSNQLNLFYLCVIRPHDHANGCPFLEIYRNGLLNQRLKGISHCSMFPLECGLMYRSFEVPSENHHHCTFLMTTYRYWHACMNNYLLFRSTFCLFFVLCSPFFV